MRTHEITVVVKLRLFDGQISDGNAAYVPPLLVCHNTKMMTLIQYPPNVNTSTETILWQNQKDQETLISTLNKILLK